MAANCIGGHNCRSHIIVGHTHTRARAHTHTHTHTHACHNAAVVCMRAMQRCCVIWYGGNSMLESSNRRALIPVTKGGVGTSISSSSSSRRGQPVCVMVPIYAGIIMHRLTHSTRWAHTGNSGIISISHMTHTASKLHKKQACCKTSAGRDSGNQASSSRWQAGRQATARPLIETAVSLPSGANPQTSRAIAAIRRRH
jgi:hypothetical protein